MSDRIYVTDKDSITVCENNLVTLTLECGESLDYLEPRRLFPVSRESEYITLLDKDGKERALIRSLGELNESSRDVIASSLDSYYLVPEITRVIDIVQKYGNIRWHCESDRGELKFDVLRGNDIKYTPDGRVRIRDSNDNRYVIPDLRQLDKKSRAKLTIYL